MRIIICKWKGEELAALAQGERLYLLGALNEAFGTQWSPTLAGLLASGQLAALEAWHDAVVDQGGFDERVAGLLLAEAELAPLLRHPGKIWGIGMNYMESQEALAALDVLEPPVGFMKPDTTLIGPGDAIVVPEGSVHTTAEAELAIVIGAVCRNVSEAEAYDAIAGFAAAIDMTEADIHAQNPRFLTRAKSFDTFLSLGAELISVKAFLARDKVERIEVATGVNGQERHRKPISWMKYQAAYTVAYHSRVMTLQPGDILITGTPGAVRIEHGDEAGCDITGFLPLRNPVI